MFVFFTNLGFFADQVKNFELFINPHQIIITLFLTVSQVLTTLVLVVITWNYAKSTKEITELNRRDSELNNRPFVFISHFIIDNSPLCFRLFLETAVRYQLELN